MVAIKYFQTKTNNNMINRILIFSMMVFSTLVNAQEKKDKEKIEDKKILIAVHYNANFNNENRFSSNFEGLVGLDLKYVLHRHNSIGIHAGLDLDYFLAQRSKDNLDYKNTLMVNPNVGIEFAASKHFKPFFNVGLAVFSIKADIIRNQLFQFDPVFNQNAVFKINYSSISINPGFRVFFDSTVYFQADYKYLPIATNVNVHFAGVGLGINL